MADTETLIGYSYLGSINEHKGIHQKRWSSDKGWFSNCEEMVGVTLSLLDRAATKDFDLKNPNSTISIDGTF